jgi:hypothetical protein
MRVLYLEATQVLCTRESPKLHLDSCSDIKRPNASLADEKMIDIVQQSGLIADVSRKKKCCRVGQLPPSCRVPALGRTLQAMPASRYDCTCTADVLSAVTTCERTALHRATQVDIHVDVHAAICALKRRVAIVARRQLRLDLVELREDGLDGGRRKLFPERM